jgi:predicted PurR-regulated permease PerM
MYQQHDSWFVKFFDGILDNFHEWLNELQDIRKDRDAELEAQIDQELHTLVQSEIIAEESKDEYIPVIPRRDAWRFWVVGWVVALIAYFLFQSLDFLYLIATGLIISMAAENFIQYIQKFLPRWVSIGIVYLFLVLFIFSWMIIIVPFMIQQTAELISMLIDSAVVMQQEIQQQGITARITQTALPGSIKTAMIEFLVSTNIQSSIQWALVNNIDQIVSMWSSYIKNAGDVAVSIFTNTFSALYQVVIVFMVAVFASIEKKWMIHFWGSLASDRRHTLEIITRLYHKLWDRLVGQLILCFAVGLTVRTWLGVLSLLWFTLPNSGTLALIAGLTEFIPYMWPILWALPAMFVATIVFGWKWLLVTAILYGVVQRLENNILVPLIMSQTLWVSPMVVFITMLLCGLILGVLGIIIAVPISVIVTMIYQERIDMLKREKDAYSK